MANLSYRQLPAPAFRKTRMCRFNILGACTRGDLCMFAHTRDALKPRPDFTCTQVCPSLIELGVCNREQCRFAHNKQELRHIKKTDVALENRSCRPQTRKQKKSASSRDRDVLELIICQSLKAEVEEKQYTSFGKAEPNKDCIENEFALCWKQQMMDKASASSKSLVKALEVFSVPVHDADIENKFEQQTRCGQNIEDLDWNLDDDTDGLISDETYEDSGAWPTIEESQVKGEEVMSKYSTELVAGNLWQHKMPEMQYHATTLACQLTQVKKTFIEIADLPAGSARRTRAASVPIPVLAKDLVKE